MKYKLALVAVGLLCLLLTSCNLKNKIKRNDIQDNKQDNNFVYKLYQYPLSDLNMDNAAKKWLDASKAEKSSDTYS